MNRYFTKLAVTGLASMLLIGCGSNKYDPKAEPTELSAYAGKAEYPGEHMHSMEAAHIFCIVAPDDTITLYNAGDEPLVGFELWVNKIYTLHVVKLDAKSMLQVAANTLYDRHGGSLAGVPASSIATVQIQTAEKFMDVQGPIVPH